MAVPIINKGQIALDPVNRIFYFIDSNNNLVNSSLNIVQGNTAIVSNDDFKVDGELRVNSNALIDGDITINGQAVIKGNTTVVESTVTSIKDPIITLGGNVALTTDDNKDRGIEFRWHNGTSSKTGFFGFDDSTGKFVFIPDSTNSSEVFSGSIGEINANIDWNNILNKPSLVNSIAGTANEISVNQSNGNVIVSLPSTVGINITGSSAGWDNERKITLAGDLQGNVSIDGSSDVTLTASVLDDSHNHSASTISFGLNDATDVQLSSVASGDFLRYNGNVWINDPVNLTTDTVGNYVQSLVAGNGIELSNNSGEGSTPTISVNTSIIQARVTNVSDLEIGYLNGVTSSIQDQINSKASLNSNATFDIVTANFVGNLTGNVSSISNHPINSLSDVVISSAQDGDFLKYNGSAWVNSVLPSIDKLNDVEISNPANGDFLRWSNTSSSWINDAVNLSTDTVGDYVSGLIAGDAIEILGSGGEGTTPTISVQDESITSVKLSPTFEYIDRIYAGNNIVLLDDTGLGVVSPNISVSATPSFESVTTTSLFVDTIEIDPSGANSNVQVLRFDTATNKFIPGLASTVAALSDLTDVSGATPNSGDVLSWSGAEWTPAVPPTGVPIVSTTAPTGMSVGQIWFNSDTAQTFIYYDSVWVEIGAVAPPVNTVTKYTTTIGDGTSNSYVVTHNLNTKNVIVEVYTNSNFYETVIASVLRNSNNQITLSFAGPVDLNSYNVVIIG